MDRPLLMPTGMRWLVALGFALLGCAESRLEELPPVQQSADLLPPVDAFWLRQAVDEATKPPLEHPRSISLGYVGDTPLTGGVMRDTPMPVVFQPPAPCSCAMGGAGIIAPVE